MKYFQVEHPRQQEDIQFPYNFYIYRYIEAPKNRFDEQFLKVFGTQSSTKKRIHSLSMLSILSKDNLLNILSDVLEYKIYKKLLR